MLLKPVLEEGNTCLKVLIFKMYQNTNIKHFRTLGGSLDENTYCYTLEVSFFSYQPAGFSHPIPYTEEECKILFLMFDYVKYA